MSEFEIDRYTFRTLPDNQTAELIAWDYRDAVEPGSYEPLFIPPIANGKQVVSIGENAFDMPTRSSLDLVNRQCDGPINQPKDVIVPETVKQLKAHAFYRQLPFHQIFLPRSLTDIDEQALDIYDYYQSTWYIVHEGSLAERFVQSHELKH